LTVGFETQLQLLLARNTERVFCEGILQLSLARAILELTHSLGVIAYQVMENGSECHEISLNLGRKKFM